jgi:hypothetical protein
MRLSLVWLFCLAPVMGGCGGVFAARAEGAEAVGLPPELKDDYALFAQRCSKCHTLARPLNAGIDTDDQWALYVARMRRMPGSGIAPDEVPHILNYLHYYTESKKNPKPTSFENTQVKVATDTYSSAKAVLK